MSDVKRYTLERYPDAPHDTCMEEDVEGNYVRFEDYAALRSEVESLRRRLEEMNFRVNHYKGFADAAEAGLSRLKRETVRVSAIYDWQMKVEHRLGQTMQSQFLAGLQARLRAVSLAMYLFLDRRARLSRLEEKHE